jgi:8-oxo-dGTP pyrophosphatase MutT (NUDIX family)
MINFKRGNDRFNYRIAGISIVNNKVLLHRLENHENWSLPGGRCELQEASDVTLFREYQEEIGETVEVGRPRFMVENFFQYNGERYHELSLMYEVTFPSESPYSKQESFIGKEGSENLIFKWFPLEMLEEIKLYPVFLKEKLQYPLDSFEHIIHRDAEK